MSVTLKLLYDYGEIIRRTGKRKKSRGTKEICEEVKMKVRSIHEWKENY